MLHKEINDEEENWWLFLLCVKCSLKQTQIKIPTPASHLDQSTTDMFIKQWASVIIIQDYWRPLAHQ